MQTTTDTPMTKQQHERTPIERTRGGRTYVPPVDIVETPDELLLQADMPGVKPDLIEIDYDRGELTIFGPVPARQPADTNYLLNEYGVGNFVRSFRIGEGVDPSGIAAELKNGVLTIHLPKSAPHRTRRIEVKAS